MLDLQREENINNGFEFILYTLLQRLTHATKMKFAFFNFIVIFFFSFHFFLQTFDITTML